MVIFRNGGRERQNEKWFYNGEKLCTESCYKYLGITFSKRLRWSKATLIIANKANIAILGIKKMCWKLNGPPKY